MRPIFSRNEDIDRIAFLNWRISKDTNILNLINMGDGYLLSAIRLAKLCLINNSDKTADIIIFPILMNANHGVEIYLKAIIWSLNVIIGSEDKIERGHNILKLFKSVRSKIQHYSGKISLQEFDQSMAGLAHYLNELYEKINATDRKDNMDFSRYPFDTKYEHHFYAERLGNVEIDLENFVIRFESILKSLDHVASFLYHHEIPDQFFE
jgi:hypothetical protein